MKILHITPSIGAYSYVLGEVTLNLVKEQASLGHAPTIWCLDSRDECSNIEVMNGLLPGTIRSFRIVGPRIIAWSPSMYLAARREGHEFQIVHQHGIGTGISWIANTFPARHLCPLVVAPHGSLQAQVLRKSWKKKLIASWVNQNSNLRNAACLHATAPDEASEFRTRGLWNPIALITNGIPNAWLEKEGDADRFRNSCGIPNDRRICLCMSSIARKKGLPELMEAWTQVLYPDSDWILIIVGDDEDGHKVEVENLAQALGLVGRVKFLNSKLGQSKRDAFAAAELFVLPSYRESFPMVVLDALGAGVPCIVTKGSAWEDLLTHGCGWWVRPDPKGIGDALRTATSLSGEQLRAMGARGRALVSSRYNWPSLARQTVELYKWLDHQVTRPSFVSVLSSAPQLLDR